jgi:hypothetical protein
VCRGSSLVERRPEKAGVASSILAPGTTRSRHRFLAEEIYFAVSKIARLSRSSDRLQSKLAETFSERSARLVNTLRVRNQLPKIC